MSGVATLKLTGSKRHFDEMAVDLPVPQSCSPARALRPPPLKRGRRVSSSSSSPSNTPIQSLLPSFSPTSHATSPPSNGHNSNFNNAHNTSLDGNPNSSSNNATNNHLSHNTASSPRLSGATPRISSSSSEPQSPTASKAASSENRQVPTVAVPNSSSKCNLTPDELSTLARHLPRKLKRVLERLASGQVSNSERLFTWADLKDIVSSVLQEHEGKLQSKYTELLHERLAQQFRDFTKFNEDYVSRQLRGTDVAYLS